MNADSVKARLKNFAVLNRLTFQEALTYYGLERTIYRISVSKYADQFVLKGGVFLYAIFDRNYERVTTDVDLLARKIANSGEKLKIVFQDIFSQKIDDALVFDLESISIEDITEFKEYHGVHISTVGYLGRTRIPICIDIGFGDIIYPQAVKMNFPVILDMDPPEIWTYSLESAISEKIEAIVRNGYLNSRYKDFYDIYVLSRKYEFTYSLLRNAVAETFENRGTIKARDSTVFGDEFVNDSLHKSRWNSFLKKKKAMIQVPLETVMEQIRVFVLPLFEEDRSELTIWDPKQGCWRQ